jgi:hypothetical protein
MDMNGTREFPAQAASGPVGDVPLELQIGSDRIDVWFDQRGIHFRQRDGSTQGHLPWDLAIAMSLVPAALRPRV